MAARADFTQSGTGNADNGPSWPVGCLTDAYPRSFFPVNPSPLTFESEVASISCFYSTLDLPELQRCSQWSRKKCQDSRRHIRHARRPCRGNLDPAAWLPPWLPGCLAAHHGRPSRLASPSLGEALPASDLAWAWAGPLLRREMSRALWKHDGASLTGWLAADQLRSEGTGSLEQCTMTNEIMISKQVLNSIQANGLVLSRFRSLNLSISLSLSLSLSCLCTPLSVHSASELSDAGVVASSRPFWPALRFPVPLLGSLLSGSSKTTESDQHRSPARSSCLPLQALASGMS